jgi:hypothetical protein
VTFEKGDSHAEKVEEELNDDHDEDDYSAWSTYTEYFFDDDKKSSLIKLTKYIGSLSSKTILWVCFKDILSKKKDSEG